MDKNPPRYPVTCEIDAQTYKGNYSIAGKILTVSTGLGGKNRQIGLKPVAVMAEQLLEILAKEGKA